MRELTDRQSEILNFIKGYISRNHFPPTYREIGKHFHFSSKAAFDHISALRKKGYLKNQYRKSRTLFATKGGAGA